MSLGELNGFLLGLVLEFYDIAENVYPLEAFATLNGEPVSLVDEIRVSEIDAQYFVKEFPLLKSVYFLQVNRIAVRIQILLGIEVHFLQNGFLLVH